MKIILAQGNHQAEYNQTRHNIGFEVLNNLTKSLNLTWRYSQKFTAEITHTTLGEEQVMLVKPQTFYNLTGKTAKKIIDYYKLNATQDLLVIHDDLDLPFGTVRVRQEGSDGGNKGLKSIIGQLGPSFWRLRIGTNNELRLVQDESNFVLSKFSKTEQETLKTQILPKTIELIQSFCQNQLNHASYTLNKK